MTVDHNNVGNGSGVSGGGVTGGGGGGGPASLTVGSTEVNGGTSGRFLYDNSGVLGEAFVTAVSATQFQVGKANNAAPTARTLSFEGATAGTANKGAYGYIKAPATTGDTQTSGLYFQVPVLSASGSTANAYINALYVGSVGPYGLPLNNGGFMVGDSLGGLAATGDANTMNMFVSNRLVLTTSPFIAGTGGVSVPTLGFIAPSFAIAGVAYPDAFIRRPAAATLVFGDTDAASPVAQNLSVQNVADGTTDTAGANWTIAGSRGTGTGAGGNINLQVALPGATGTTQNALATMASINGTTGLLDLTKGAHILPAAAPSAPASGWVLYVDSGDGNKLKAIASTGTVVPLGTP